MAHQLSPSDLQNNPQFELIKQVAYTEMKDFVLSEVRLKSRILKIYSLAQLAGIVIFCALAGYFIAKSVASKTLIGELKQMLAAGVFSFTLIIPIHEGIHALAFILLGKKDIGFGVQWKKFMFYAESNLQVLNRKQMLFVALAPFTLVSVLCIAAILIFPSTMAFFATLFLAHIFFCSGDWAIVSFFQRHLPYELYTFDSRNEGKTFYFRDTKLNKN